MYTDRLLTLCLIALTTITTLAVLAAPWIVSAYTDYTGAQRDLTLALARYCLPQIARDRFGAIMWTPVLNNVIVIAVFGLYPVIASTASTAGEVTDGQLLLLGLGSTADITVQALTLLPSLRAAGVRWRPRFDWRGSGLGRPVRAAVWTVLLVLVNQVAYSGGAWPGPAALHGRRGGSRRELRLHHGQFLVHVTACGDALEFGLDVVASGREGGVLQRAGGEQFIQCTGAGLQLFGLVLGALHGQTHIAHLLADAGDSLGDTGLGLGRGVGGLDRLLWRAPRFLLTQPDRGRPLRRGRRHPGRRRGKEPADQARLARRPTRSLRPPHGHLQSREGHEVAQG